MGLFWLTLLAVVSLWIFVSLGVALSLHQEVGRNTWHLRLLQSYDDECYPETKCAYFNQMLFVPVKIGARHVGMAILFVLLVFFRVVTDWIVRPIGGEYPAHALQKDYWKELVTMDENDFERSNMSYSEFPLKRFSFICNVFIGLLFWFAVLYFSYQNCKTGICTSTGFGVMLVMSVLFTILGFVALIRFVFKSVITGIRKSFIAAKNSDWWKMLTGKLCATLTYKD